MNSLMIFHSKPLQRPLKIIYDKILTFLAVFVKFAAKILKKERNCRRFDFHAQLAGQ